MNNTKNTIKLQWELEWEGEWFHSMVDTDDLGGFDSYQHYPDHAEYIVSKENTEEFLKIAELFNATIV